MTFINVKYINLTFPLIVYNTTYRSNYTIIHQGHMGVNPLSNILGNTLFIIPIVYILSFVCFTIFTLYCLARSEEHTSELQSRGHLVCRLLLEKKKQIYTYADIARM